MTSVALSRTAKTMSRMDSESMQTMLRLMVFSQSIISETSSSGTETMEKYTSIRVNFHTMLHSRTMLMLAMWASRWEIQSQTSMDMELQFILTSETTKFGSQLPSRRHPEAESTSRILTSDISMDMAVLIM